MGFNCGEADEKDVLLVRHKHKGGYLSDGLNSNAYFPFFLKGILASDVFPQFHFQFSALLRRGYKSCMVVNLKASSGTHNTQKVMVKGGE